MGYSTLEQKIAERGIKKSVIAAAAGITAQTAIMIFFFIR